MANGHPSIVPTLRYHDAPKAIEWLCQALGFEASMVSEEPDGSIGHAQLQLGNGMVMVSSVYDDEWGKTQRTARELGGNSQSAYIIVEDCVAHYEHAKAAGARIVMELEVKSYGGQGYGCLDPEGNVWSFGSYDPFAEDD